MSNITQAPERSKDIVDTAVANGSFKTLATALTAAGLVSTLKETGPFTVFAPTDAAFAALPAGTVEALLGDLPRLKLILLYHVVPGRVLARDVVKLTSARTASGEDLTISAGDEVRINDARILNTDIAASNGVIHVIDRVLMPR